VTVAKENWCGLPNGRCKKTLVDNAEKISFPIISVAGDAFRYIPSRIIPALGGFLSIAIYTRFLGPRDYGLYTLVTVTISMLSVVFVWINKPSMRYFEEYKRKNALSGFISTSIASLIFLFFVIALIWYALIAILKRHIDRDFAYLLKIGVFVLIAEVGYFFVLTILQAERKSLKYSVYTSINTIGKLLVAICLLWLFSLGPQSILWAILLVTGGLFCLELASFFRRWSIKISRYSKSQIKRFASYGFPLIGESIGMLILAVSDRYMIQYFLGPKEVGIYSAGYNMVASIMDSLFGGILMLAALPVIFQTFEHKGEVETRSLLKDLLSIYSIILVPVVLGIAALSKSIVGVFLDKSFQNTYIILPWVAGGILFWGATTYVIKSFELREKTLYITYLVLFAGGLNILLNLFFIPVFGIIGAGLSTLASYLCCFIASLVASRRIFLISFPWISFGKSFLAATGMYLILSFGLPARLTNVGLLIIYIFFGMASYFAILALLREKTFLRILLYLEKAFEKRLSTVR